MNFCKIQAKRKTVYVYEYGEQLNGLKLTYNHHGHISPLENLYTHVIPDSELKNNLEKNITYLKVKSVNPVSEVQVIYTPQEQKVVNFFIKNPIAITEYIILAYAKEREHTPFFLNLITN
ncbi:unnamed protein product [Arctia plantaginis]|uniref:Uncharacterized protein n=1 Tax=Arctia plantaginis TaxID=874455 RepID=A0A8S1A1C5_ARCPL|nr:unnamed protein product [Arctia plantaginis]